MSGQLPHKSPQRVKGGRLQCGNVNFLTKLRLCIQTVTALM